MNASPSTGTNLQQLIVSRRTTFQFQNRPVPDQVIENALEAARWAPNHKLTQPWRFILPGPQLTQELKAYLARRLANKMRMRGFGEEDIQQRMSQPQPPLPAQILVYNLRAEDPYREQEDFAATSCAIQNLMLSAWAEGVASGWKSFDQPEAYQLFGLNPEQTRIIGLIQLGYPLKERESRRRPLEDVVERTA